MKLSTRKFLPALTLAAAIAPALAALEAGKVIMLEKTAVLEQARAWGISLLGFA